MAQNSDGSIVIDTELDNTGFEKGSDKLLNAVEDLTGAVDNLGDNMMRSFQSVIPLLQSIAGSAQGIYAAMSSGSTETAAANQRVAESEEQTAQAAQKATQAMQSQGQALGTYSTNASAAHTSISSLEKEVNSLSSGMESISKSSQLGFANSKAVLTFESKLTDMEGKIDSAKQKLEAFGQQQLPTEEYTWYIAEVEKAEAALNKLLERQIRMKDTGVKTNSKSWKNLTYDIEQAEYKLQTYRNEMTQLEDSGDAFTTGANTAEYAKMQEVLKGVSESLNRNKALIDAESIAQARLNVQAAQERVARATTAAERQKALASLKTAQEQLNSVAKAQATGVDGKTINGWKALGAALQSVKTTVSNLARKFVKLSFGALSKGVSGAIGKLKNLKKEMAQTGVSSTGLVKSLTSLRRLLITRIKRMFISAIFDQMKECLNSLALFNSAFNQSMSNIKNRSTEMSANLAVSMGNLISAIEPIVTKIISAISTAISYLNALFAMLGGKSTVTVAKKQMASYADSTKKAAGAAKDLKNQVYGFDELNRRSSDSNSGGGGDSGADLFEEVPIDTLLPDQVQSFFDRIKSAIEAGDWYGVGGVMAEGLNLAMGVVDDWINGTLRPMGVLWAGRIAEVLNGLVDGTNWGLMGKTIADGLNAVADIINTFLTTFDFENFGNKFGDAINGFFGNVEWNLIGQTFANKWNALIDFIYGVVNSVQWELIGSSISDFVNNFFSTVDFHKAALAFSTGFNGIFEAIKSFTDNTQWTNIAQQIYGGLNTAIHEIKWEEAGKTLSEFFVKLLGTFLDVAKNTDWQALGRGIGQFLSSIDWMTIIGDIGTIIWEAFSGVLDGLFSTSGGKVLVGLGVGLLAVKGLFAAGKYALSTAVKIWIAQGTAPFAGMLSAASGLVGSLSGILGTIGSVIFSPTGLIIAGIVAGVALIVTHWDEIKDAAGKVKDFVSEKWGQLKDATSTTWGNIKTSMSTAFGTAKTAVITTAGNIRSGISTAWSAVKTGTSTAWSAVKTAATTQFNSAKTALSTTASGIKTSLSTTWGAVKTNATQTWSNIKTSVSTTFTGLKTSLSTTANGIKTAISTTWSNVKSTATSKWSEIKTTVSQKWSDLKDTLQKSDWTSVGSNLVSGLLKGIQDTWHKVTSWVGKAAEGLTNKVEETFDINSPSRVWAQIGEYLDAGLLNGLQAGQQAVVRTAAGIAQSITDGMSPDIPELSLSEDATVSGLDSVAEKLISIADTFRAITDMLSSIGGFTMPQIAAGTVVPYQTKISPSTPVSMVSDGITDSLDGLDERMSDVAYLLKQLIAIVKSKNLNIDLDALTRMITKQKRERELNFGG